MRNFPVLLLDLFSPTPESALTDCSGIVSGDFFVDVEGVTSELVNHESHLVLVTRLRFPSLNLRCKICGRHFTLANSHVAHLWTNEVHTVTGGVDSVLTPDAHVQVDVDVSVIVCDCHVGGC